uniref:PLAT domain-containing protein n=1 Tax=Biomphalaria glabrata TaxID=6526 RepID=A0A2C9KXY4_BIOGL
MSEEKNNDLMYMAYITARLRHLKDSEKETLIPMLLNELSTERDNINFGNFHLVLVCLERIIKNINLNLINLNKAHELLSYVVEQQFQVLIHATLNRVLTNYEINILDNIVQVFLALKQVGLLPSGPEELIISEGLMNTLDSILRLVAGDQIKGYPEMDKRSLTNSEVFTTWIDSSSRNVVEVDFLFHYLYMDMEIFYQGVNLFSLDPFLNIAVSTPVNLFSLDPFLNIAVSTPVNLFSLDPFLNIAVYTSFWSLLPNEQGGAIIDLPLLVISVEQKLPTQYALEKFVPDRYDIRFKHDHVIEQKDRYFFNMRTYLDQSETDQETPKQTDQVQTGSNSFSDSDCLLIKVDISQHYSTMLHINGLEKMKMEVRASLYNSYAETLDIINEPPMILPRNETIYKNMLVKENVVFLPKLSLKQSITSAGGHYFVLINYARDQEVKGIQAGISTITMECTHVSCFWWSMYDDKWFSKFCRESAHTQHGQNKIPIISCFCDTGNIFSAGSSQCSEGHLVDWSSFELETLQWFDLNDTNLFMAYIVLCLTMVFVALLVWSVRKDRLEYYECRTHVAPQLFSPWCTNNYIVCISTGVMPRCGTTAIPSITLIGDENFSFLISLEPLRGLFRTGSEVWFLLSTRVPLGNLLQAVISVDKTGNNRNWFISHMYLRHLETKKEWYFICDSWIPDTKTKKPFIIVDASSTPGSPGRLRLYAFIHHFRMHQLVVGSFFNMSNGYTKTPHVLLMWLTILLNFTIINAFMNLIRVQLRSDAAALRKKSSENVYTSATLYSVIITSLITYFLSLVFQRTNTISSLDSIDWKTEFHYESSREAGTRTAADKLPDIVDSNEDTRASEMTSELIDSPDPKLRSEAYKTTGLSSPESTDKQRSGEQSLMSERTKSQRLSYNKVSKESRNLNTNSLPSASKLRVKRVGSPVDPESDRLRILAYHNYIELLENLAIAYPKGTWRKNIFTRHKASIRHSYPLIQTCLMMLPTIIFLSYFLAMNGYFLGRNWNFILSALAGLLAIIFLLHPFYIFLSLLMMEGLNLCSGDADVRLKACLEALYTKAKCTALGKLRPRRVVNFENSEIPPTMIRYSKLIAKASKKSTETVNSEESKTEKESGRADKIFTVMFILMIIFFINVQTGDIHSSYLQSQYIKRLCQVGRTEIILDTSLLMEDFWYKMRESFFSKPSYVLNSPQTTSTYKAVSNGRIQQYRVLNQTDCREKNPKLIEPLCHFDVENTEQDTRHFAFTWAKPTTKVVPSGPYKHTQTEPYVTINHFYPPGGYEVVYSIRDTKPVMIDYLESKNWVDFYTRAVKIDLALYNADTKMLTVIEHVFEFTSIGITQESIQVSTFPLIYSKDSTNMLFLMVILISVFNVAFGIADIILIHRRGFRKHFSTYFSWLNLLERIFSVCVIVGFLVKMSYTKRAVKDVQNVYFENKEATVYIDFAFALPLSQHAPYFNV